MRVLDLSGRDDAKKSGLFPEAEIDYAAVDCQGVIYYTHDVGPYDVIVTGDRLPRCEREKVLDILKELVEETLRPGGQIHIMVPSLEWAARRILQPGGLTPEVFAHLYGADGRPFRTAFTMVMARDAMALAGLAVTRAQTVQYLIAEVDGRNAYGDLHYLIGVKPSAEIEKTWLA